MVVETKKRPRLIDIARVVGVSKITVAKALHGTGGDNARVSVKTAEKIRKIASELNYQPNLAARQLGGHRSNVIGVIIDSHAPENVQKQLAMMEQYAARFGFRFMVGYSHGEMDRIAGYAHDFISREVDGVICLSHTYPGYGSEIAKLLHPFANRVFIEAPLGNESASYVTPDFFGAASMLTSHLISLGRRRIGIVLSGISYRATRERLQGHKDALQTAGLPVEESLIWANDTPLRACLEDMSKVVDDIMKGNPDAIIGPGDGGAMWLVRVLSSRGIKVPEDIGVTGFDLWDISQSFMPAITTVDLQKEKVAKRAIEILIDSIEMPAEQDRPVESVVIEPKLIVGESCGYSERKV